MQFIGRLIFHFFSNILALAAAMYFVAGFSVPSTLYGFLLVAAVFTLINAFIRPFLKLLLTPIIVLTFGLGIILVNALTLYMLDMFFADVTIAGLLPLLYATLIIGAVNTVVGISARTVRK